LQVNNFFNTKLKEPLVGKIEKTIINTSGLTRVSLDLTSSLSQAFKKNQLEVDFF